MKKIILFTDDFFANSNHCGLRFKAKDIALSYLAFLSKRSGLDGVGGICSSALFLEKVKDEGLRRYNYGIENVAAWNSVDFSSLHSFADALYSQSKELGMEYGLVHRDIPLLSTIELRWLLPLFFNNLIYVNTIKGVIEKESPDTVRTIGRGPVAGIVKAVAAKEGPLLDQRHGLFTSLFGLTAYRRGIPDYRLLIRSFAKRLPSKVEGGIFSEKKTRPRILFIGWIDRSVERLVAALPSLRQNLDADIYLLAEKRVSLTENLRRAGVKCSYSHEWINTREGVKLTRSVEGAARRGWDQLKKHAPLRLGHSWYGVPIFPYAEPILRNSCLEGGRFSAYYVEVAKRAVERCQPDMVVCFEDWELPRAVTLICRQRKIPTVAYYALSSNAYNNVVVRSQEWMAVSGDVFYNSFLGQYGKERICAVGDTLVDRAVISSKEEARRKVCSDLGLSFEKPIVLLISFFAASPFTIRDVEALFKNTGQAVNAIKGAQLIVKTHPLQATKDVKKWIKLWGCKGRVVDNYNLFSLCSAADIVSVPITTAIWQAMLARTPVVSIQYKGLLERFEGQGFDYLENKGVVHISPDENAAPVFEKLIYDNDFRLAQIARGLKHVQEHVGPLDGNATLRLTDFFKTIMGEKVLI